MQTVVGWCINMTGSTKHLGIILVENELRISKTGSSLFAAVSKGFKKSWNMMRSSLVTTWEMKPSSSGLSDWKSLDDDHHFSSGCSQQTDICSMSHYSTACVGTVTFSQEVLGSWPEHQKCPGLQIHHLFRADDVRLFRNIGYNATQSFFGFIIKLSGADKVMSDLIKQVVCFSPNWASREHPAPSSLAHQDV